MAAVVEFYKSGYFYAGRCAENIYLPHKIL